MINNLDPSWQAALKGELSKPYFIALCEFLENEREAGKKIYPPQALIFNAFNTTPIDEVSVVILGQDPYHKAGQAMGLSFSVPRGVRVPPSLKNIYKELQSDLGCEIASHGDLSAWANQGVFLLNAALTVEEAKAGSHLKKGWSEFTDAVIKTISEQREGVVFMLWGNFARGKADLINSEKHLILEAAHPSPLARGAYFGSAHFSQANGYLKANGQSEVDWGL